MLWEWEWEWQWYDYANDNDYGYGYGNGHVPISSVYNYDNNNGTVPRLVTPLGNCGGVCEHRCPFCYEQRMGDALGMGMVMAMV